MPGLGAGSVPLVAKARRFVAKSAGWCGTGEWSGVKTLLPAFVLALVLVTAGRAQSSLDAARRAQELLGPEVWSRVITIENENRHSPYPRTVHALIFELAGILWFYTDHDGTQSFSLHVGRVEEEKADFAPLLRDIDPGFRRWAGVERDPAGRTRQDGDEPLRNGCFVESVVALRERLGRGGVAEEPRLLSYYAATSSGRVAHTVLAFNVGDRVEIVDPAQRDQAFVFPRKSGASALALARALVGRDVVQARYVPLRMDGLLASAPVAPAEAQASVASVDPR